MGAVAVRHALAAGAILWRAAARFACSLVACSLQNRPVGSCLRFDAGSPRGGPRCAHPAITNGRRFAAHLPAGSTKKRPAWEEAGRMTPGAKLN